MEAQTSGAASAQVRMLFPGKEHRAAQAVPGAQVAREEDWAAARSSSSASVVAGGGAALSPGHRPSKRCGA